MKYKIIGGVIGAVLGVMSVVYPGTGARTVKSYDSFNPGGFTKADPLSPQSIMRMR